jgi:hypothetical protein
MAEWRTNVDLFGYFQTHYTMRHVSLRDILSWFKVKPEILAMFPKPHPHYAACHLRQGDYVTTYPGNFCIVDKVCYERAIAQNTPGIPVAWIEENQAQPCPNVPPELSWLSDWMTLYRSDVIYRGNSTFSFWAAVIGQVPKVFSPAVRDHVGHHTDIPFSPNNEEIWFPGGQQHSMRFAP